MDFTTRDIYVEGANGRIYGQVLLPQPAAGGRLPLVIFSHEFGADHTTGTAYGEHLAESGVAFCAFDFCGGTAGGNRSQGEPRDMSVRTEEGDLDAVLDAALSWDFVDKERIFLMGGSQGGVVSALVAPRRPADIRGLILNYPAFVVADDAHARFDSLDQVPDQVPFFDGWFCVGRRYIADLWDLDLYGEACGYQGPVLINHGDQDPIVPLSYARRAARRYANCELHVIEGAGHGFEGAACREAQANIDAWLSHQ